MGRALEPYVSTEGGFQVLIPADWTYEETGEAEGFFAVRLTGPEDQCRLIVQRFKTEVRVTNQNEFEAVVEGVLLGLEESLGGVKVLERKFAPVGEKGLAMDLVLRGKSKGRDILQRRRLLAPGPVPPAGLFLITASCLADRFLVHRATFEKMIDGFCQTST